MNALKRLIVIVSLLCSTSLISKPIDTITLDVNNTYSFKTAVRDFSVDKAIDAMSELDAKLESGKPIYLYLDSPGGSIIAGMRFINFLKSLDREVKTISSFSASMAFVIVQSSGERLALPNAVLMSHPGSTRCQGNQYQIASCLDILKQLDTLLHTVITKRMKISYKEYIELIKHDKYFIGKKLIKYNVIDRFVRIKCTKALKRKKVEAKVNKSLITRLLGKPAMSTYVSACPLLNKPLKAKAKEVKIKSKKGAKK